MPTVAILGASGYSGQETLDRVLRHPELEVVALGSDSLAGESASALDVRLNGSLPAFVSNEQALAAGADLVFACLGNERAAAARAAGRTPSSSTSPARTGSRTRRSTRPGTASSIRGPARSPTGATACPSSSRRRAR